MNVQSLFYKYSDCYCETKDGQGDKAMTLDNFTKAVAEILSLPVNAVVMPEIAETIEDGFGNTFPKYCGCGYPYEIVRPGKIQCPNCY